jgi:hypothetical protein
LSIASSHARSTSRCRWPVLGGQIVDGFVHVDLSVEPVLGVALDLIPVALGVVGETRDLVDDEHAHGGDEADDEDDQAREHETGGDASAPAPPGEEVHRRFEREREEQRDQEDQEQRSQLAEEGDDAQERDDADEEEEDRLRDPAGHPVGVELSRGRLLVGDGIVRDAPSVRRRVRASGGNLIGPCGTSRPSSSFTSERLHRRSLSTVPSGAVFLWSERPEELGKRQNT